HVRATHNFPPEWSTELRTSYPAPLAGNLRLARVVRECRLIHVLDMQDDQGAPEETRRAQVGGYRTWICVPFLASSRGVAAIVVDGDLLRVAATHGVPAERVERFRTQFPVPVSAKTEVTQLLHDRRIVHLVDIEHNPAATPQNIENARLGGYRTRLMVPMLRGDSALGLIAVTHQAPIPFSDQQVALLQTFADQAVIAIENVRLFKELEARNHDLT